MVTKRDKLLLKLANTTNPKVKDSCKKQLANITNRQIVKSPKKKKYFKNNFRGSQ